MSLIPALLFSGLAFAHSASSSTGAVRIDTPRAHTLSDTLSSDTLASDTIIAKYYRAVGGRDKLLAIKSRRLSGSYKQGSVDARTMILWRRPGVRRIEMQAPGINHAEGYDGSTWEHDYLTGKTVRDTGVASVAGRQGAEFDESFVQYAVKHNQVRSMGEGTLDGNPSYGMRVTLADGSKKDYFFDGKTGLIIAVRKIMVLPGGRKVPTLTSYESWSDVGGVMMPHKFVERNTVNGGVISTTMWDTIEVNVATTAGDFKPPVATARR